MIWFIILLGLVLAIALPVILEARRRPMTAAVRKTAPGKFVELSQGVTHYQWLGPVRGPVAVLIHGLSTPSTVWKETAQALGDTGYRVLVYDLYGRGFSDAPDGVQDVPFFLTQLNDLLAELALDDDLTLVGYSMGGTIATAFAANEPHRMKRLILLAPAGIATKESKFSEFCRTKPIIGDWVHGVLAGARMRRAIANDPASAIAPDIAVSQRAELQKRGYLRSVLSSRRNILEVLQEQEHRSISRNGIPVIAIWGEQDSVIPIAALGRLAEWNRVAHQEVVAGAGHALPYSHGAELSTFLRAMLRSQSRS
ncbi:pimeloyl-ACP methyl ester carboxylesterase [Loktanella ponticola]|uniref:Pimeloyl-ACP methyl ester carboxylesterase n=1 Tax=Yoonia ponticola TaxID=1524255 RepID=A0A7W9BM11_9RHOB|nr:alpha/beta hydrolase [Yoonia ponticola]MBB5723043.1 pimeloyl-ACP methyl ester carboxylesterase [Yoonia ponticola]